MPKSNELPPEKLRYGCDPSVFTFKTTEELVPLDDVIGQERAVRAIDFGLNMKSQGYHIFVTGSEGTGKTTIVQDIVGRHAKGLETPVDWCMVHNFADAYRPRPLRLPPGDSASFSKNMTRIVDDIKGKLAEAVEGDAHRNRLSEIEDKYAAQKRDLYENLEKSATEKQLAINKTSAGFQTVPIADGKPMSSEAFQALSKESQSAIEENIRALQAEIENSVREAQKINFFLQQDIAELHESVAEYIVKSRLAFIREKYRDSQDVLSHLNAVEADIVENVDQWILSRPPEESGNQAMTPTADRYAVNILVSRTPDRGAPVVFEPNPTYRNLFGRIEKRMLMGNLITDFTMVQSGSLLEANGGFLILEVNSVLMNGHVWESLKRALQNRQLFIEESPVNGDASLTLRPLPIALDVKVILIGGGRPFYTLQNFDDKFNKLFKVRADFDDEVPCNQDTIYQYARFIARVSKEEGLLPFTPEGVAAVVEFGQARIAKDNKLSIRFGPIVGMIKEAEYWARQEAASAVTEGHVERAIREYRFRYNLAEEKIHEAYVDETIMIDVDGDAVGQVNALAVYHLGEISFGRPSRITAETYMGKHGVVNIEREAKLSGKTHDKGVLILSGFLGKTFARKYPLSLTISIAFEQSYGGVDGDSASSTELYAILSSLSGYPIHQGLAVTGSVNQKGDIQAIGGVNQKIEGFFDVCCAKTLTGRQGVLIPEANVKNLILKKEVVNAVAGGTFHIYPVKTVAQGIEILTGVPAGEPDRSRNYPAKTVFGAVQRQLKQYLTRSLHLKKLQNGPKKETT